MVNSINNSIKNKYLSYYKLKKNWIFLSIQLTNVTIFSSFNYCYMQHGNNVILNLNKTLLGLKKQLSLFNLLSKIQHYPIIVCSNFIYNPINFVNKRLPLNFLISNKNNLTLTNNYNNNFVNFNTFTLSDNFVVCLSSFNQPFKLLVPIISTQIQLTDYIINLKSYNFLASYFYLRCLIIVMNYKYLWK